MSTRAQISANQQNAQHSCGPKTEEGKAHSCLNNSRHGLSGDFRILPWEDREQFVALLQDLKEEHQPATTTETLLVEKMAQHQWLVQRALMLQELTFHREVPFCEQEKQLALYLRYQTTHDRAFNKSLDQLLKLRAEKRKAEIGFESQRLKEAEQTRKDSVEKRKQDMHKLDLLLAEAKADHQLFKNWNLKRTEGLDVTRESQLLIIEKAA